MAATRHTRRYNLHETGDQSKERSDYLNKCVKVTIYPDDLSLDKKQIIEELFAMSKMVRMACNKAMNFQFNELMRKINEKEETGTATSDKVIYGKTFGSYLENKMNEWMPGVGSANVAATRNFVTGDHVFNPKKILTGEETITTFRSDMPIYLHNKSYKVDEKAGEYTVLVSLFNIAKQKDLGCKRINFKIHRPEQYQLAILNRIILGEYKQGSGQIKYNRNAKKWQLIISYSFVPQIKKLSKDKILGIDLGITNTATMSIYDCNLEVFERVGYKESVIDGRELIHFRQKNEARRRSMLVSTKTASDNKIGHGRKQRCADADKLNKQVERFRDTYNHKVSRYIVDFAVRKDCGVIQMEDLKGYYDQKNRESFLKQWSYFDLQQKIIYKAEEKGIVAIFIKPEYTSKRCSVCGCIDNENRDCKKDQAKFKCIKCSNTMNADINASRNIALPNIEQLIEDSIAKV